MNKLLKDLIHLHEVEVIEQGLYRCHSQTLGFGHVFGGQVMGQALAAAKQRVPSDRILHSFHAYFLRAGDDTLPIVYRVEVMRDGGTYSARRVEAIQKGQPIFYATCSFKQPEEGLEYQAQMPQVPMPETLQNQAQLAAPWRDKLPPSMQVLFSEEAAFEFRPVDAIDPRSQEKQEPTFAVWLKANGQLSDDLRMHRYLLAYASDFNFLTTASRPHGLSFLDPQLNMATIDHAMWFHRSFRVDEWLLYVVENSSTGGGRAFVQGRFFTKEGLLVAQTTQEGVFRLRS
tara:strand:- start:1549 stop:2409 length:861 start_codon:yes stop_codon:yes gene_type:complete